MPAVRYPHIFVKLTGVDGNVFNLVSRVSRELHRNKVDEDTVTEFTNEIFDSASYSQALAIMMRWVNVR